jgi:hypothetical protein
VPTIISKAAAARARWARRTWEFQIADLGQARDQCALAHPKNLLSTVMPGFMPGIHVFAAVRQIMTHRRRATWIAKPNSQITLSPFCIACALNFNFSF